MFNATKMAPYPSISPFFSSFNNFVESIKTDAQGIARSSLLPIENAYYVRESINYL